jgi:hypothetical protein
MQGFAYKKLAEQISLAAGEYNSSKAQIKNADLSVSIFYLLLPFDGCLWCYSRKGKIF